MLGITWDACCSLCPHGARSSGFTASGLDDEEEGLSSWAPESAGMAFIPVSGRVPVEDA